MKHQRLFLVLSLFTGIIIGMIAFALFNYWFKASAGITKTGIREARTDSFDNSQPERLIDKGDWNMAFLFPDEIAAAREQNGLVILPVGPVEWHGPHLVIGCDNLLAHDFARRLSQVLECPYYPPLYIGTERERNPDMLEALGFERDQFIEGMDFPGLSVKSAYVREEIFAGMIRDILDILLNRMGFTNVLIINGHGADNQKAVLNRLCMEYNAGCPEKKVKWVYPAFPR